MVYFDEWERKTAGAASPQPIACLLWVSRSKAGHRLCNPAEAAGRIARQAPIDFGHERCALLVARQDEGDLLGLFERHHHVSIFLTGHPEDVFYTFGLQTLDEEVGRFHRGFF